MSTFEYVLQRGVSPLTSNHNDHSSLHFAIEQEKLSHISYLLEGDFDSFYSLKEFFKEKEFTEI